MSSQLLFYGLCSFKMGLQIVIIWRVTNCHHLFVCSVLVAFSVPYLNTGNTLEKKYFCGKYSKKKNFMTGKTGNRNNLPLQFEIITWNVDTKFFLTRKYLSWNTNFWCLNLELFLDEWKKKYYCQVKKFWLLAFKSFIFFETGERYFFLANFHRKKYTIYFMLHVKTADTFWRARVVLPFKCLPCQRYVSTRVRRFLKVAKPSANKVDFTTSFLSSCDDFIVWILERKSE